MKKVEDMNYYELLNIEPTANNEEIQRAYQLACQTYQPDSLALYSVLSDTEREEILEKIEKAYRTLMDKQERERYNRRISLCPDDWQKEEDDQQVKHPSSVASPQSDYPGEEGFSGEEESLPELSDSQYLKKLRERKGISLQEISDVTKISVKSLTALENGVYDKFPGRVYIVGFLRAYAEYIGIDVQQAKAHFEILYAHRTKK